MCPQRTTLLGGSRTYDCREVATDLSHALPMLVEEQNGGQDVSCRETKLLQCLLRLVLTGVATEDQEFGVQVVEVEAELEPYVERAQGLIPDSWGVLYGVGTAVPY